MRKMQLLGIVLMMFALLACSLLRTPPTPLINPTDTPYVVCTPPACASDEVYYCEGECLGGCGTTCATPTAPPPTPTFPSEATFTSEPAADPTFTSEPAVNPTFTSYPMCTPPACASDEVYYCEGECLGGCGTTCATPTPEPVAGAPVIQSFTADRSTIVQGETVNVTWQATGGTEASMIWLGDSGTMDGIGDLDPDGGTLAITPKGKPVTLRVSNSQGTTEANLIITIMCANDWVPELSAQTGKCPRPAEIGWAAQQPFEHGFMLWLEPSQTIYVIFDNYGGHSYRNYIDTFQEGDPESDPNLVPPAGLLQPVRGFGLVWRTNPEVRDNLGWATAVESGFETWLQRYQGFGMHNVTIWLKDINRTIYELDPMGSVWEVYTP